MDKILLYSGIYGYTAEEFTKMLFKAEGDVEVWINSPGGSIFAGWSIIGAMAKHEGAVHVKVMGYAASMAFYTALFGDTVEALDVSTFLIHRADGYVSNEEEKQFLANRNKDIRAKLEKRINADTFKEVTGVSIDEIFDAEKRIDVVLNAKQAKKIGLVDKIIRLDAKQIQAMSPMTIADFAQGSAEQPQGSGIELKKEIVKPKIQKKMDINELKANHPDLVAAIVAEERDRVEAYLTYVDVDPEACKKGIESGNAPTHKFFAEMNRKAISGEMAAQLEAEAPEAIQTPEQTPTPEATEHEANMQATLEAMGIEDGKEGE